MKKQRKPPRTHLLVIDEELTDPVTGQQYCLCGLAADNERHRLSGQSEEQGDQDARRIGERNR